MKAALKCLRVIGLVCCSLDGQDHSQHGQLQYLVAEGRAELHLID